MFIAAKIENSIGKIDFSRKNLTKISIFWYNPINQAT